MITTDEQGKRVYVDAALCPLMQDRCTAHSDAGCVMWDSERGQCRVIVALDELRDISQVGINVYPQ